MLKRAGKLEDTVLKEINKAKKKAIKEPVVNSAEALEATLALVLSSSHTILSEGGPTPAEGRQPVLCASSILPSTVFPGVCADDIPGR